MKTNKEPATGKSNIFIKSTATLGVFALTLVMTFSALNTPQGLLKSSPYTTINVTSDAELASVPGATEALDKVVSKVKTKAEKYTSTADYNAYLTNYLTLIDEFDNSLKTDKDYTSTYSLLFKYIYPRVYALQKDSTGDVLDKFDDLVDEADNIGTTTTTGTTVSTGTVTPTKSCATKPTFANIGTTTTGTPTSSGQAWTYSATPGNCTYSCSNNYTGTNCATPPTNTTKSCATKPTFANIGITTTGNPTSANQAWTYSANLGNCTYTCKNGYSGSNCATRPECPLGRHMENGACTANTVQCTVSDGIPHAIYMKEWNATTKAWGECKSGYGCDSGYDANNNCAAIVDTKCSTIKTVAECETLKSQKRHLASLTRYAPQFNPPTTTTNFPMTAYYKGNGGAQKPRSGFAYELYACSADSIQARGYELLNGDDVGDKQTEQVVTNTANNRMDSIMNVDYTKGVTICFVEGLEQ